MLFVIFYSCASRKNESNDIESIFNSTNKIEIYAYYDQNKWERNEKYE